MLDLRVLQQEAVLPLPEVLRQLVVGLLAHHVFFDLVVAFYFLDDGVGVEVGDGDDHSILHPVEVQGAQVLLHRRDYLPLLVLEGEPDVRRLRSVSLLDVFLEGEDGGLGVEAQFWDAQRGEVVLKIYLNHVFVNSRWVVI